MISLSQASKQTFVYKNAFIISIKCLLKQTERDICLVNMFASFHSLHIRVGSMQGDMHSIDSSDYHDRNNYRLSHRTTTISKALPDSQTRQE